MSASQTGKAMKTKPTVDSMAASNDSQWVATKGCGRLHGWLQQRLARRLQEWLATLADSKVTWADALGCDEGSIEGCELG
jgi:hypothetical protein